MSNEMINLYNRDEIVEYSKRKYTEIVARHIEKGYQIEPSGYSCILLVKEKETIRLEFSDSYSSIEIYMLNYQDRLKPKTLMKYRTLTRNGLYISEEEFLKHIKPKREARKKRNRKKENNSYKINTENISDEILDKLKKFNGFKRVTKKNLKIYKVVNRYSTTYYFNSGTKPILLWETTREGLQVDWLEGSDKFNIRYNKSK